MMGFLDVLNWRDVASVSCACWAGVLGDQAVNVVGQNSGLKAGNQSHGEVTAIDQANRAWAFVRIEPGLIKIMKKTRETRLTVC
jgi:hypothetical protein